MDIVVQVSENSTTKKEKNSASGEGPGVVRLRLLEVLRGVQRWKMRENDETW